jgi:ATP-dependent DNA helicase RecG
MFRISLEEGKAVPDFSGSDEHQVKVGLFGVIQNPRFVGFLEGLSQEMSVTFAPEHLWALDYLERNEKLPDHLADTVRHLESTGVISRVGRGRGSRLMLSRRFHRFLGSAGDFTRKAGLDRETNKELLIKHIRDSGKDGARLEDLRQVLRDHSADQVQTLIRELSKEGRVHHVGRTRAARWYLANAKRGIASS